MNENTINISNKRMAFYGASITIAAVFFYSLMVMVYVLIRSSLTICEILPSEERTSILVQNGITAAYSIAVFSILSAIMSSIIGMVSAIILKNSLFFFNPKYKKRTAFLICGIIAISINGVVYSFIIFVLKDWMTFDFIEPFLFWFLIPAILFLIISMMGGKKLNELFKYLSTKTHV